MRNSLLTVLMFLVICTAGFATPLSGSYSIPGTLPTGYPTLQAAIADLNANGVESPGVTFNIAAGYTETFTAANAGYITTVTGSSSSPIIFQRDPLTTGANPLITAATGSSTTLDAIIAIAGCDYITFDGIDLHENALNTTPTTQMEWGYAILKASATDGSQNITIKNCQITLDITNTASTGIYSNNHTTASLTQLAVTAVTGANSYLKIFSNTLTKCYFSIYLSGYNHTATPYAFYDQNNEIGKDGANYIDDIGGGTVIAYGIFAKYQNNLKVANNRINTITAGSKSIYGIYLTTANNASYDLYNNNVKITFTPTDGNNANFYPIYSDMGGTGTTNAVNIYNNTVSNCVSTTIYGATVYYMFILNLGVTANVYGNTISGNSTGSASVNGNGPVRYLWVQKASTTSGPIVVHDNSVTGNTKIQSGTGVGLSHYLGIAGSGTTLLAYKNLISDNVVGTYGGIYGLYVIFADAVTKDVYSNTVRNLTRANGSVSGLYSNGGKLGRFFNNTIQNISADPANTTASINGIYQTSSGTSMYFYNNFVSELSCPGSVSTLGYDYNTLNGIYVESSANARGFYNNTVYLNATSTSSLFGSSAFCAQNLTGVDLRNNIFVNNSACRGTGVTAVIRARSFSYTNFTSNYNNLFSGAPGATSVIYYYGSGTYGSSITLDDYKFKVSPNDLQSVTELPPFVNVAASPYNLHLQTGVATQCEAGGFVVSAPVAITTDYDTNFRFPNAGYPVNLTYAPNAPDIGADEIGGMSSDLTAPAISYTPFTQTSSFAPRTLMANITDGHGVPTLPGDNRLPVLYWKLNSSAYQAVQGTWVSGSTYSFTFGTANAYHDIVSYYIVAQDTVATSNVGALPWQGAAGFTANPPACSTPPTTPSSYLIIQDITGIHHVGVGKEYTTLTAAATDLNDKFMTGPVSFILDDENYPSETFPILFNANPGNNATNTLTIKPNTGMRPAIIGSVSATGLILMNGLDYVTVDGSGNGGTDKGLTIVNSANTDQAYTFGITNNGGTDPSTNITLKNCNLMASNTDIVKETHVIVFNQNGGTTGGGYNNCTITGNTISRSKYGIMVLGSAANMNQNLTISNNIIGSADSLDYILRWGIDIEASNNTLITGNEIMGPAKGVGLAALFGITYWNGCTNTKITKNKIHDWYAFGPGSWGIKCSNDASATVTEISNNLIYNIKCYGMNPGTNNNLAYGIYVRDGGNMKIWHNSIYLSGPFLEGIDSYQPSSACIGFMEWVTDKIDMRNNTLRNSMTNPSPDPGPLAQGKAYAVMICVADPVSNGPAMFTNLDYNDYFVDGHQGSIAQRYGRGGTSLTEFPTLASWQTYIGKEAHTITDNPMFVSDVDPVDLHPTNPNVNCMGGPKLITTDYANATRYTNTDMGAYEWSLPISVLNTVAATGVTQTTATLNGNLNTNSEYVILEFDLGLTTAYDTYLGPTPGTVRSVNTLLTSSYNMTGLTANTTYHFRFAGFPATSNQAPLYGADFTFTTLPLVPVVTTTAATVITTTGATLNGTVKANGATTAVTFEYGLTNTYGSTATATPASVTGTVVTPVSTILADLLPNTLYHYRTVGVNAGGTTNGNDLTFTTSALPPAVATTAATSVTSTMATLNGSVNANGASTAVTFQYGLTAGYGFTATATPSPVTGTIDTPVLADITGLLPNTLYHYRVVGVSIGGTSNGDDMTFTTNIIENQTVTGSIAHDTCYNASQTITVAGPPTIFEVTATGHVTMIAGMNIIFLPGTTVQPGGYLHGSITTTGEYCGAILPSMVAVKAGVDESPIGNATQTSFRVYPNPTTGAFTLDIAGESEASNAKVEIFSMCGDHVFSSEISGNGKHELSLSGKPVGIYLVRVISGNKAETARIIKQ